MPPIPAAALSAAVAPLKVKLGDGENKLWEKTLTAGVIAQRLVGGGIAVVIASLNVWLLAQIFGEWFMTEKTLRLSFFAPLR